jgi:oligoribonuclease
MAATFDQPGTPSAGNLIWIDLEMTGLDTMTDQIIEIATIVTDQHLNEIAEGPVIAVHQTAATMQEMDDWNTRQHGASGLIARVLESPVSTAEAEVATLRFLQKYVSKGVSPMCGNGICQDRRFLARQMPALEAYFHYRNLDVSSVKILAERWAPAVAASFRKESSHRALSDIRDSIAELAHYRALLFSQDAIKSTA